MTDASIHLRPLCAADILALWRDGHAVDRLAEMAGAVSERAILDALRRALHAERGKGGASRVIADAARPFVLAPTRVIGNEGTAFGPDVEHADAAIAAADTRPFRGGRYPKVPHPPAFSEAGSPALSCVES